MATPVSVPLADPLRDLAARIFVELVCRNVVVTESAAQIGCNPENLAKISFKLAEAFQRIDLGVKKSSAPVDQAFDLKSSDLPGWNEAKA